MNLSEKDFLKKLLSKKEVEIIESLGQSDKPEDQIDRLLKEHESNV